MDYLHISFGVVIVILIYIIYQFRYHYMLPNKYPCTFYPAKLFKTGDLIFFKSLKSDHKILTGSYFSHIGMIIVMNGVPHVLELVPSNVKMIPLDERYRHYSEGQIAVKSLNKPLDQQRLAKIPAILDWAKTVVYSKNANSVWINDCMSNIWDRHDPKTDFTCDRFIAYVLYKFDLIDANMNLPCSLLNHFEHLSDVKSGYSYGEVRELCYIDQNGLPDYVNENFRSLKNMKF